MIYCFTCSNWERQSYRHLLYRYLSRAHINWLKVLSYERI